MELKSHFAEVYPKRLKELENAKIAVRRSKTSVAANAPPVGVALSGGGIRSATFCLGVFQALARQKLIGKIDFLSTVSGGGYFGSFLGALIQRGQVASVDGVEATLSDSHSSPVNWLRENGRYLSPNGAGGFWVLITVMLRNWVAIQVVLLTFLMLPLTFVNLFRSLIWSSTVTIPWYEKVLSQKIVLSIWWSPFLLLSLFAFLPMLFFGVSYWFTQSRKFTSSFQSCIGILLKDWQRLSEGEAYDRLQNRLTRGLMISLMIALALLVFAIIDSVGQTLYARWSADGFSLPKLWTGISAAGIAVFGFAQKIAALLEKLPSHRAVKIPVNLMILIAALAWVALIVLGLSVVTHGLAWQWDCPWPHIYDLKYCWHESGQYNCPCCACSSLVESSAAWPFETGIGRMNYGGFIWLVLVVVVTGALSLIFGHNLGFINLSSYQQLYAARLKRAYIGASNPLRQNGKNYDVTDPLPDDDIAFEEYHPDENGGPLHIINVTVNETISGKSQIEDNDRKGFSMAIGPCGLSVGDKDHALWINVESDKICSKVEPLIKPRANAFHTLCGNIQVQKESTDSGTPAILSQKVERLPLGNWISLSGAAVSTGMGANTNLGLSLLLGLANVRLGYWWDCGVDPEKRTNRTPPHFSALAGEMFARIFPAQSYLFDEFLARFHGPARRHWYLSDGGHFENTAGYELIRRRVPFIIICDAGCDTTYTFEDIANFVRKARIDFNAEIEFLRRKSSTDLMQTRPVDPLPALDDLIHPELLKIIGVPEDFAHNAADSKEDEKCKSPTYTSRHALFARVRYLDSGTLSWILFLKPSLTGDEPTDLLQYQTTQPDFPQETTSDQFFNEAQWESYRKLGEHIGGLVFNNYPKSFSNAAQAPPTWTPHEMKPPQASVLAQTDA